MKAVIILGLLFGLAQVASAGQGPAGATGACHHVLGPVDNAGNPIGFTCTDVGGNALLVWNASQLTGTISVTGGIKAVNLYPGSFSVDGTFTSDGALAFIGGGITVTGTISAASVLIAGVNTNATEVSNTLLGTTGRITGTSLAPVTITETGIVTATSGNLTVAGSQIANAGQLTAKAGTVAMKTGTQLDIGWNDINWIAGAHANTRNNHSIRNDGTITAADVVWEAHRTTPNVTSMTNAGTISVKNSITFVSGVGGGNTGNYGVFNASTGTLYAATVTISPYSDTPSEDRSYSVNDPAQQAQLVQDIGGGQVYVPTQDNPPTTTSAPVIDAGKTFTVTGNIIVPQLAPSLTNLNAPVTPVVRPTDTLVNATTKGISAAFAAAGDDSDRIRGDGSQPKVKKPKARAKAKPVLVRGAFFDSKISAVITSNR